MPDITSGTRPPSVKESGLINGLQDAISRQPTANVLKDWLALASGTLGFEEYRKHISLLSRLTYLTLDVTGTCDLTCAGMCYYHPGINLRRPRITEDVLRQAVLDAASKLSLQNLVFAGKEPLLNPRLLFSLLRFAASIPGRNFAIGIVTNGRHILRNWDSLAQLAEEGALDFLDISIDSGIAIQHDNIRGLSGTFDLASAALARCTLEWERVRVGVSSVLRQDNSVGILELYRSTASRCQKFFVTPIQPPPFTSTKPLSWAYIEAFLGQLINLLETDLKDTGIEVMISLLGIYVADAVSSGLFAWHDLQEDAQGQCFAVREIHGNRLILHCMVLPETGTRIGRVTFTGAYLPNSHFLQTPDPDLHAVGFLQEEPIAALYQRAAGHDSILQSMLYSRDVHDCRTRPCWSSCFGGLTVAENCAFDGWSLEAQPRICLRA